MDNPVINCKRDNNYDLLRIIATVAVIMIHVNFGLFSSRYTKPDGTLTWTVEALINIITRFSVPSFVMLSGAYNLKTSGGIAFYKKTSYKVFLPTMVVIVLLFIMNAVWSLYRHVSVEWAVTSILMGRFYNLWYMYMLAGLYLLTPLIFLAKEHLSVKQYTIVSVLMMIWAIISQATSSTRLPYSIGVVFPFAAYYMLGDVLYRWVRTIKNVQKTRALAYFCSALSIIISYIVREQGFNYYVYEAHTTFFSPCTFIYSVAMFVLFGTLHVQRDLRWLSNQTFYVYLFHTAVLHIIVRIKPFYSEIVLIAVQTTLTFFLSLVLAALFGKEWECCCKRISLREKWYNMGIWKKLAG